MVIQFVRIMPRLGRHFLPGPLHRLQRHDEPRLLRCPASDTRPPRHSEMHGLPGDAFECQACGVEVRPEVTHLSAP